MAKLDLSPWERESKPLTRALATDNAGNEILIGLTHDQLRWYLDIERRLHWRAWEHHNDDRSVASLRWILKFSPAPRLGPVNPSTASSNTIDKRTIYPRIII